MNKRADLRQAKAALDEAKQKGTKPWTRVKKELGLTPKPKKKPPRPGTIAWAATRLNYSVPTVYKLIRSGQLRTYGTGHARRISEQAILDCIALLEGENGTISPPHPRYDAMVKKYLRERDSKRNIGQELLTSVREMKVAEMSRTLNEKLATLPPERLRRIEIAYVEYLRELVGDTKIDLEKPLDPKDE